jgi:hypothetical protein
MSGSRALSLFLVADDGQNFICEFVLFKPVTEMQGGALIGKTTKLYELRKLAVDGLSKKASSILESDKVNHCCMKCVRNMVCKENGGSPVLPSGQYGAISFTKVPQELPVPFVPGTLVCVCCACPVAAA